MVSTRFTGGKLDDLSLVGRQFPVTQVQVVHLVVKIERRLMTLGATPFAEEHFLASQLLLCRLGRNQLAERIKLWSGGEIEQILHLSHHGNGAGAIRQMNPFLRCDHMVAVEIGGALLEFREILDATQ